MKFILLISLLFAVRSSGAVSVGMPESDLLAFKGVPKSKAVAGARVLYRWPDMQVTTTNGIVSKFEARDSAAEAADAERRAKIADELQLKENKARALSVLKAGIPGQHGTNKKIWAKSVLGQRAPDLVVEKWLSATTPELHGKFLLIDFWATWCGPCRKAIPELNEIHRRFSDRLTVIGISDEPEAIVRRMKEPRMDYFVAIDPQAQTKKLLAVTGIPHAILVDPAGIVRWEGYPLLEHHELTVEVVGKILAEFRAR